MDVPDNPIITQMERTGDYHPAYEDVRIGWDPLKSYQYIGGGKNDSRSNNLRDGQAGKPTPSAE